MSVPTPLTYFRLDESSGNATDQINSLTATNTSATYAAAKLNNGATYGGTAFHTITDNAALKPTSDISFGGWVNFTSTASYQMLIAKGENAGDTRSYEMRAFASTTQIEVQMKMGGATAQCRTTAGIGTATWKHVIFTRTGTTQVIYVDAVAVALSSNVTQSGTIDYSTDDLWFGQRNGGLRFNGRLDEIGIWNVALTSAEVTSLYNAGAGFDPTAGGAAPRTQLLMMGVG